MVKNANGEGSIRKRGSRWQAQVSFEKGKKRVWRTFRTKAQARAWLKEMLGQVDTGLTYESTKTTLSEFLADWLETKESSLRPATFEQYRRMVRLYLDPGLGQLPVGEITAARVQAFYSQLRKKGTGARTIRICHTVLHGCLKHAHRLGLVTVNPAGLAEVPKAPGKEMQIWTESQVSRFLAHVGGDPFYRLVFATGMRRGELLGLKWADLDWLSGILKVQRAVYHPEGGGFVFQAPKTARGIRGIRLGPGLVAGLREQQDKVHLMRQFAGQAWQENDLVFPSSVGTPRMPYETSKKFKDLAAAAGLPPIRFHDIRHTAASLMLHYGIPPVQVAGILGQSLEILMTTYSHWIAADQGQASTLMDGLTTLVDVAAVLDEPPK